MAWRKIDDTKLTAIADAIRGKTGGTDGLTLDQMPTEIAGIETGGGQDLASFTYTGDCLVRHSSYYGLTGDYAVIALTSSGIISFTEDLEIDVFMVGAGGGGRQSATGGGGGGGGGYTNTVKKCAVNEVGISVEIGAGGEKNEAGGVTSFGTLTVGGGNPGTTSAGGDGGSGGGGPGASIGSKAGAGGSDGSNGTDGSGGNGGNGQNSTTRAFGEKNATPFAGGGGGKAYSGSYSGGAGGGGATGVDGTPNTGGGGGAGQAAGAGGSGIVLIRPAQAA